MMGSNIPGTGTARFSAPLEKSRRGQTAISWAGMALWLSCLISFLNRLSGF